MPVTASATSYRAPPTPSCVRSDRSRRSPPIAIVRRNFSYAAWGSALLAERNAIAHTDGSGYVLDPRGIAWTADAGWQAIGDATAAFDPLSSHGLISALWGGRLARLARLPGSPAII
jgi:hypothetical protein